MSRLPSVTLGSSTWALPFSPAAGRTLAAALVEDDPDARRRLIIDMLSVEPPVILWTILVLFGQAESGPKDLPELASRLADDLPAALRWRAEAESEFRSADRSSPPRDGESCQATACAAEMSARDIISARGTSDSPNAPSYLRAVLLHARDWLTTYELVSGLDGKAPGTDAADPLPRWLGDTRSAWWRTSGSSSMELSDADELADRIRRRWHEDRDIIDSGWWETFLRSLAAVSRRRRELEHSFDKALRREKLASLKELAYGAGHEINNPLANISSRAQTLLRDETDPERRQKLATINRQAFRVYEMISNMMHFAHPPAISPRPVDVVAIADQVLAELSEEAAEQGTEIGVEASSETVEAFADPVHLAAALKALCQNSLEAIAAGGHVRVAMRREKDADGRRGAVLEVADDGPGLSEQARRHLFDPFYSGREAGRGLGFGLSKCWRVVELHGGHVEVAGDDRGTRFTIWLPDAEFASTVAERPDAQAEVAD